MPNTKYDRFFVEEFTKKIKKTEDIEELVNKVKNLNGGNAVKQFEEII